MTEPPLPIGELVDGFIRLVDTAFDDLRFTASGGELDLRPSIPDATMVRIELPRTDFLHLSSVIIEADGLDDPVRQTTRTMSSVWKEYDQLLDRGVIFDPDRTEKAFHTRKESHPWLEIGFDRPRDLSRIRLRNCSGPNSLRARGIVVGVQTADGRYRTVYDATARERALVRAAESYANRSRPPGPRGVAGSTGRGLAADLISRARTLLPTPPAPAGFNTGTGPAVHPAAPQLVRIMTMITLQDDGPVRWALDRVGLTAAQLAEFRDQVNRRMLFGRERELTSHGIRRSFRFWTDAQRQRYLAFALEVIDALRELTPQVCFGFGSALAIVRDHNLIPHDDDLDVLIGFEPEQAASHAEGRRLIRDCLVARGFTVTGGMTAYQWVTPAGGGPRLDVFIGVFEGDAISWYPGRRGALDREMMFPAVQRDFLGRNCPVPARPERYLEQIYGTGWVDPDPNFTHRWEPSQYADIAGT